MPSSLRLLQACALLWVVVGYNLNTEHPILYEISGVNENDSYFGMSVALRPKASVLKNTWSIQIGAPRANVEGSNFRKPGAVYRCEIYGPCRMVSMDGARKGFRGNGLYGYKDKKDDAWIGISMDIKEINEHERSVVCGNRWVNQNLKNPENIDLTYLMTGVCYLQDLFNETSESSLRKLLPLVDVDKIYTPKPYVVDLSTYHWGLGQAGTSVVLTEKSSCVLIGAPGVTHWMGSVIRYDSGSETVVGDFAKTKGARKNPYAYMGYSVGAGKFFSDKKLWFVAGAPRSANYHGQIFIFTFNGSSETVYIRFDAIGTSFGEYFGAALATPDVNGDGFDDLIVGAPSRSNKDPDEGRIYVYLGNPRGDFLLPPQAIDGRASRGRFGTCVTSLEDLDRDGFEDVAVGAPYEEEGRGAVYIFRGNSLGLVTEYAQRVTARRLHPALRGFGISISPAVDVDGNNYRDVAVGSYLSGHVVLLRSSPVVFLHPEIKIENNFLIDRRSSLLNVSFCSKYTGSSPPVRADLWTTIEIDPFFGRGLLENSKQNPQKLLLSLVANKTVCEIRSVRLNLSGENYSPLLITLRNELPPCRRKTKGEPLVVWGRMESDKDDFPKWCPIGNVAETSKEIPFAGICGTDEICESDLEIVCGVPEFKTNSYVLGSSVYFRLWIHLKNLGEPARNVKFKIWSNSKLRFKDHKYDDSVLDPVRRSYHWLDVDGTFLEKHERNFSYRIGLDYSIEEKLEQSFLLIVEVYTSSSEVDSNNNRCRFSINLISEAFVDLYSSSSIKSFFITKKPYASLLNVTHYYEVQKSGVTPVKDASLTVYIPSYFNNEELLTAEVEAADWMHFSSSYERHVSLSDVTDSEANHRNITSKENCPPANRTLFLNCSNIRCHILKIFFTAGIPSGLSSHVKILISLNISAIDFVRGEKDIVHFSTSSVLRYTKLFANEVVEIQGSASLSLYNEESLKTVDGYVIGLSVLAGGFFLSLIVTGLVKGNFFKRTKKQELKALKEAEASFIYFSTEPKVEENCTSDLFGERKVDESKEEP